MKISELMQSCIKVKTSGKIAAEFGITDVTLSKKLRFEIDADEKR